MKKLRLCILGAGLMLLLAITACGAGNDDGLVEIHVGIGIAYYPFIYQDEDGNLTGFDLAVLREINERLPHYRFVFTQFEPINILLSVETGRLDVGAYQIEWNPARAERFLFSRVPTNSSDLRLVVSSRRTDIQSMYDLGGMNVFAWGGTNPAHVLETFNEENGNLFNLVLAAPPDFATLINNIYNGTWDAFLATERDVMSFNITYGDMLQVVGDIVAYSNAFHIFNLEKTELMEEFERALQEMIDDGTLLYLSERYLGGDFTVTSPVVR